MQTVEYTTFGTHNAGAYSFHPGLRETVTPDEAARLVKLGVAKVVESDWKKVFSTLKDLNAGIMHSEKTDPDFLEAARQFGLSVRKK